MEKGKTTSKLASTLADEEARLEAMKASRTDFQQAADILQKAVEDNPAHGLAPKVKLLAGECLMRAENWDAAIPVFTAASENQAAADELRAESLYWLAECFMKKGDPRNAELTFTKVAGDYTASKWSKFARGRLTEDALEKGQGE